MVVRFHIFQAHGSIAIPLSTNKGESRHNHQLPRLCHQENTATTPFHSQVYQKINDLLEQSSGIDGLPDYLLRLETPLNMNGYASEHNAGTIRGTE